MSKQNYRTPAYRMYQHLRRLAFPGEKEQHDRIGHLWRKYRLSAETYAQRLAEQGGVCFICTAMVPLHVDHDHRSGKLRKLLCRRCNTVLGFVEDSPELLLRFVQYLREHSN